MNSSRCTEIRLTSSLDKTQKEEVAMYGTPTNTNGSRLRMNSDELHDLPVAVKILNHIGHGN
jgi:hypothetical protein